MALHGRLSRVGGCWLIIPWIAACASSVPPPQSQQEPAAPWIEEARAEVPTEEVADATPLGLSPSKPELQFALAQRFATGQGVPQSRIEAARWAALASRAGYPPARDWLTKRASEDAIAEWYLGWARFRGATEKTETQAGKELALRAMAALTREAEQRPGAANYVLGFAAAIGFPIEANEEQAFLHYQRGAGARDLEAQAALADAYLDGKGVAQSDSRAAEAFELAARQGHAFAQYALGWMHLKGRASGFVNGAKAAHWYQRAAEAGLAPAQLALGRALFFGTGVPQDLPQALNWYAKAAAQGDGEALLELGDAAYTGLGANADLDQARQYWTQSAEAGNEQGRSRQSEAEALIQCRQSATVQLLSVPLACALRSELRIAALKAGAKPRRVDDNYWADIYDSSAVLEGTEQLVLLYTNSGRLARATYTGEHAKTATAKEVLSLLVEKYGPSEPAGGPRVVHKDKTGNHVEFDKGSLWVQSGEDCGSNGNWKVPDGLNVQYTFSSKACSYGGAMFVVYSNPEREADYDRESNDAREQREEQRLSRQRDAL